jgi:colanic acid biosynthesis protein WcaH
MFLDDTTFKTVIASTPLISIDLVIKNTKGEYLLGFRNNRPAQGFWFVPGGRILKDETMDDAFIRLCKDELGVALMPQQAVFLGAFEHFYSDCVFGEDVTTHYVVLGYAFTIDIDLQTCLKNNTISMPGLLLITCSGERTFTGIRSGIWQ